MAIQRLVFRFRWIKRLTWATSARTNQAWVPAARSARIFAFNSRVDFVSVRATFRGGAIAESVRLTLLGKSDWLEKLADARGDLLIQFGGDSCKRAPGHFMRVSLAPALANMHAYSHIWTSLFGSKCTNHFLTLSTRWNESPFLNSFSFERSRRYVDSNQQLGVAIYTKPWTK